MTLRIAAIEQRNSREEPVDLLFSCRFQCSRCPREFDIDALDLNRDEVWCVECGSYRPLIDLLIDACFTDGTPNYAILGSINHWLWFGNGRHIWSDGQKRSWLAEVQSKIPERASQTDNQSL